MNSILSSDSGNASNIIVVLLSLMVSAIVGIGLEEETADNHGSMNRYIKNNSV